MTLVSMQCVPIDCHEPRAARTSDDLGEFTAMPAGICSVSHVIPSLVNDLDTLHHLSYLIISS